MISQTSLFMTNFKSYARNNYENCKHVTSKHRIRTSSSAPIHDEQVGVVTSELDILATMCVDPGPH